MNPRILCAVASVFFASGSLWGADAVLIQFERNRELLNPVGIEFFEGDAPKHAENFKKLVQKGFYKGLSVHRVLPGTLIQLGDPLSRGAEKADLGTGGPGYTIPAEIRRKHTRGAVGMGRLPDAVNPARLSNGSQFYVALKPLAELDGVQTVFARVFEGLEVLDGIGGAATDTNDSPVQRVVVKRAVVVSGEAVSKELNAMKEAAARKGPVSLWRRAAVWLHLLS